MVRCAREGKVGSPTAFRDFWALVDYPAFRI
jgi:hypothetical protein